ncbi:MAG: RagB/SusD family nutrient uptake outer membrane protein [Bacteroidota bacterium]|nr:RagB/SusD family nutrient uptake outer membrane protein [Bacteroidota bacterium]
MKYNKIFKFLFIAITFLAISCKKQLDLQPTDSFSEANAFLTLNDVQLGTNAAYGRYGAYANDMYVSALLSDEAKLGIDNNNFGALTYRYQFSSDATTGADVVAAWGDYYALIDQVNRVLPFVATVTASPSEEPRRNILKGQLLALRAIANFDLLENYSKVYDANDPLGIPILLKSDPLGKPARNTVGEVMTQIETDLATAKGLLPTVTVGNFSDTVMNKINIAAYQARIALYKRDYTSAITYSSEVINSGVKPLVSGIDFQDIWTDDNSDETLFRIRYATSSAIGGLWSVSGGQILIAPSDKLVASYDPSDIRLSTFIGTVGSGDHYVNKFYTSSRGGQVVDMKACRIAEMYLIRAEAYARSTTPNLTLGAADLNELRSNRISGYVDETFSSASDLIDAVMNERFKELCFEGFRFYDLKRNGLPVERLASDANAAWQTLPASSYLFVLPIPRTEMNANPNMIQNAQY